MTMVKVIRHFNILQVLFVSKKIIYTLYLIPNGYGQFVYNDICSCFNKEILLRNVKIFMNKTTKLFNYIYKREYGL